jgi:F-type H+-transporting ATPase subunit b
VNFAIFFVVFKRFIAKPLLSYLQKQQNEEMQRSKLTEELQSAHAAMETEKVKALQELKQKQSELISEAKKAAEETKSQLLSEAQKQSQLIVESGKQMIAAEKLAAEKELLKNVKAMAQVAVEKGLSSYLNLEGQKAIQN